MDSVYSKKFSNGLRLVVKKMDGLLSVSMGILVGTGSCYETAEENGISHYIEHMMFKGTKTRSPFEISDGIDRLGSQINAYTAKENTCYYIKSTKENFAASAEILEKQAGSGRWLEGERFGSSPSESEIRSWLGSLSL